MAVRIELNIPPHFFDSAKECNNFESVSERIAKAFLSSILNVTNIRRGDAESHEPDYISSEIGYEVTFAINESLIPQLKGLKPLDDRKRNIETELINTITDAVIRKAEKTYSCKTCLVLITLETLPTWYYSLYFQETDPFAKMAWRICNKKRDSFFEKLYGEYIANDIFDNIYIIQPTCNSEFALFDVRMFGKKSEPFITRVKTNKPKAFPTCKVVSVGEKDDVYNIETIIINHTIE